MDSTYIPLGTTRVERHRIEREGNRRKFLISVLAVGALLIVLTLIYVFFLNTRQPSAQLPTPSNKAAFGPTSSVVTTVAPEESTWPMAEGDYENNRWFGKGIREIKEAKTEAEAIKAAEVWLDAVKRDPTLLQAASLAFLDEKVAKDDLVTADGMASEETVVLASRLELELAQAEITPAEAPTDAYNSGVSKGTVVAASAPGITGDLRAIKVTNTEGKTLWIMGRCGNIAVLGAPRYPSGPTDQPPVKPKPRKAPDTTNGAARQPLRDENAVRTPTPGYPGNAEEVVKDQEARPKGGTDPTPYGTPGTGTGDGATTPPSSNSSGETNSGGGQSDTTPPPGGENTGSPPKPD